MSFESYPSPHLHTQLDLSLQLYCLHPTFAKLSLALRNFAVEKFVTIDPGIFRMQKAHEVFRETHSCPPQIVDMSFSTRGDKQQEINNWVVVVCYSTVRYRTVS